jgi:S-formylglutathione hydrolase FrmB
MLSPRRIGAASVALVGLVVAVAAALLTGPAATAATAMADDGAHVVAQTQVDDHMVDLTIASPAVGGNVMVRLILPAHWSQQPARTWPALYLLDGANEPVDYQSWTHFTDAESFFAGKDVLVVLPSDGSDGIYSDWHDLGFFGGPKWETFHTTELPQLLGRGYRASGVNAVAGVSIGGMGAMDYAARHPGLFRAAASYSGLLTVRTPVTEAIVDTILLRGGHNPLQAWGSSSITPQLWNDHDATLLAPRLAGVKLFVSSGNGNPFGPFPATAEEILLGAPLEAAIWGTQGSFVATLRAHGIPVTTDFYGAGVHTWPYWERELQRSWPLLAGALGVPAS